MPFEAAKAVAATFCWRIRHALTPLFGLDFPSMCVPPEDRARFGRMIIDAAIVQKATESANYYRMLEKRARSSSRHHLRTSSTPGPSSSFGQIEKDILPKPRRRAETVVEYDTDSDKNDDKYCCTPPTPYRNAFTPVNTPRGPGFVHRTLPSPKDILESMSSISRAMEAEEDNDSDTDSTGSSKGGRTRTKTADVDDDVDDDEDDDDEDSDHKNSEDDETSSSMSFSDSEVDGPTERESTPALLTREMRAAHALLTLHMQDTALDECEGSSEQSKHGPERKRRRASA